MRMTGESSEILYLTNLERESTGAYACSASNTEGETRSMTIQLNVQCKYLNFPFYFVISLYSFTTVRNGGN
jgi:hypothetical protein